MSCSSPFVYYASAEYETSSYTIGFSGSTSVSGYKIPSEELCLLGWNPGSLSCSSESCLGGCVCDKWKWCKCCTKICNKWSWTSGKSYWYDCWSTPSVTLMPDLDIQYNLSTDQTYELAVGESISVTGAQSYIAASIKITKLEMGLTVNGTSVNIDIPIDITITQTNGEFAATYDLVSVNEEYTIDGIEYEMKFSFALQACADPVPPVGWLNIEVDCDLSIVYEGTESYSVSFEASCPIVSVDG